MKIAVVGWYDRNNFGDDALKQTIKNIFQEENELVFLTGFNQLEARIEEVNKCDYLLIGGGGLIQYFSYQWPATIEKIKVPFGLFGVSVETSTPKIAEVLKLLSRRAEFIYVRDEISFSKFEKTPSLFLAPDLTFYNPYQAQHPDNESCTINLRPWQFWMGEKYTPTYFRAVKILNKFPALENLYPGRLKFRPKYIADLIATQFDSITALPFDTNNSDSCDKRLMDSINLPLTEKKPDAVIASNRYLIAMRFHALVFACQMGIPFLSISYSNKNEEFMRSLGLEKYSLPLNPGRSEFARLIKLYKEEYEETRNIILKQSEKFSLQTIETVNYIKKTFLG